MSTTILQSPPTTTEFSKTALVTQTCHQCGADLSHTHPAIGEDAQRRISELESQVKILTGKATAAVDKLADYEDELRQLKSTTTTVIPPSPTISTHPPSRPTSSASASKSHIPTRFSNLLPSASVYRRATSQPDLKAPPDSSPPKHLNPHTDHTSSPITTDLLSALTREQSLRQAAESRVSQTNEELEELSAQLFTEANEMVASERKARAKLEERVAVLERRDREKRGRLEALEGRLGRIERVRGLLGP